MHRSFRTWAALVLLSLGAIAGTAHSSLQAIVPVDEDVARVSTGHGAGTWEEHLDAAESIDGHACSACCLSSRAPLPTAGASLGSLAPPAVLAPHRAPAPVPQRFDRGPSPRAPPLSC